MGFLSKIGDFFGDVFDAITGRGAAKEAARAQRDAAERRFRAEQREATFKNRRSAIQTQKAARISRARAQAAAQSFGGLNSSAIFGGLGAQQGNLASNVGFGNALTQDLLSTGSELFELESKASRLQEKSANQAALFDLGTSLFTTFGGTDFVKQRSKSIFDKAKG